MGVTLVVLQSSGTSPVGGVGIHLFFPSSPLSLEASRLIWGLNGGVLPPQLAVVSLPMELLL